MCAFYVICLIHSPFMTVAFDHKSTASHKASRKWPPPQTGCAIFIDIQYLDFNGDRWMDRHKDRSKTGHKETDLKQTDWQNVKAGGKRQMNSQGGACHQGKQIASGGRLLGKGWRMTELSGDREIGVWNGKRRTKETKKKNNFIHKSYYFTFPFPLPQHSAPSHLSPFPSNAI